MCHQEWESTVWRAPPSAYTGNPVPDFSLENPSHVQSFLVGATTWKYLVAVSLGSTFFGANTYIGNGPDFMAKSLAESAGMKCPSLFGYVTTYTLPTLIPLFAWVSSLILR